MDRFLPAPQLPLADRGKHVLAPHPLLSAGPRRQQSSTLKVVAVLVAFAAVGAASVAVVLVLRQHQQERQRTDDVVLTVSPAPPEVEAPPVAEASDAEKKEPATKSKLVPKEEPDPRPRPRRRARRTGPRAVVEAPNEADEEQRQERKQDPLGALIDGAMERARRPVTLSRSQIASAMSAIKDRVAACYSRHRVPGMAMVRGSVSGERGRLESVSVTGLFAGTPTGACVLAAARKARFPRFSGPSIRIKFPFMLR
jgi:hypothetical protein